MLDPVTVSPLRQRMIEGITIRRFGEHTQREYVRQVRGFTAFLGLPPDRVEPEGLRRYQIHLGLARRRLRADEPGLHGAAVLLPRHVGPDWLRRAHGADPDA
jgi:hypothetical protein